jgi:hypothetical protein
MHLAAGHVTVFFRVARNRGKALRDIHLPGVTNALAGIGVFSGAVEFENPLMHVECREVDRCERFGGWGYHSVKKIGLVARYTHKYCLKSVDISKRRTLFRYPANEHTTNRGLNSMYVHCVFLQPNRAVTTPAITRESIATLHSPECFSAAPVRIVSEHLPRMNAGRARGLSSVRTNEYRSGYWREHCSSPFSFLWTKERRSN